MTVVFNGGWGRGEVKLECLLPLNSSYGKPREDEGEKIGQELLKCTVFTQNWEEIKTIWN